MNRPLLLCALASLLPLTSASAELELGAPFSEHMVVQADRPVPVWGRDAPGAEVTVRLGDATASATCDAGGRWRVELPAVEAGGPLAFEATGTTGVAFADVLAGDLWWCSGQSNMEWPVAKSDSAAEVAAAPADDRLRLLPVPRAVADEPREDVDADWAVATGDDAQRFSAVALHFGEELRARTGRPVGLIRAAWGGTGIAAWVSPERLEASGEAAAVRERRAADEARYAERLAAWEAEGRPGKKPDPGGARDQHQPSGLHHGMVAPFAGLPVRGVIWYQGESDSSRPGQYAALFPELVAGWREGFARPDLPVYFVQLPNFKNADWVAFRETQRRLAQELEGVGMAVAIDAGEVDDVHPGDKRTVGERLARLALADAYGLDVLPGGPRPVAVEVDADEPGVVRVRFDRVGGGLASSAADGSFPGFEVEDAQGRVHPATAAVEAEGTLRVRAEGVERPAAVHYAQAADPDATLVNSEGLPAGPFVERVPPAADEAPAATKR